MDTNIYNFGFFQSSSSSSLPPSSPLSTNTTTFGSPDTLTQENPFQLSPLSPSYKVNTFETTIPVFDYNSVSDDNKNKNNFNLGLKDDYKKKRSPLKVNNNNNSKSLEILSSSLSTLALTSSSGTLFSSSSLSTSNSNNNSLSLIGQFKKNKYTIKSWIKEGSISFYIGEEINRSKIAAFDMDETLIKTASGKTFPQNEKDWVWWNEIVPDNLRKLYNDGYQVVIITNQGGIGFGAKFDQSKWNIITKKICILEKELDFPLIAIASCTDDEYRKPNNKMWYKLSEFTDGKVIIDQSESFYCGDAAGRPENWKQGHKADFSSSDYGFALSSGIRFETPETHFFGEKHYKTINGEDATSSLIPKAETSGKAFDCDSITSKDFEVVINVGFPASGKSTFSKKYFEPAGYIIINQDTLKTKYKCLEAAKQALSKGKSVIIDNTNPTVEIRSEYIKLAKQFNAKVRCLHFQTPRDLAEHLNYYRERTQNIKHISTIVYNIYKKNFVEPTINEGFESIIPIKFILDLKPNELQQYNIPNPKAHKFIK